MGNIITKIKANKRWICLLLVLFCLAVDFRPRYEEQRRYRTGSLTAANPWQSNGPLLSDAWYITRGLKEAHSFPDTLKWWTGTWTAGPEFEFYRPLTSYFWWVQHKIWGQDGLRAFMTVNAILHAVFVLVLWLFLTDFLGLVPATLACCSFVLGLAGRVLSVATPHSALELWIDTPEMTCGTTILLALWCYLRYLRGGSARYLSGACVIYIIGILWKESAYTIPFFALLLLWHEKQWGRWRSLLPLGVITVCGLAYRTWALQGRGYHLGSNNSWKERYITETMGGQVARMAVNSDSLALSLVCAVAAGLFLWKKQNRIAIFFGIAGVFFLVRFIRFNSELDSPFLLVLLSPFWLKVMLAGGFVFMAYRFVQRRERGQLLGWGWVQCAYLPLTTAPITAHAMYFVAAGWAIWLAYVFMDLVPLAWNNLIRIPVLARFDLPALPHGRPLAA